MKVNKQICERKLYMKERACHSKNVVTTQMHTLTDRKRVQKYIVIVNYIKKFVACCLHNLSILLY